MRDLRTLVVGLMLGVCLVLAMGQAPAVNAQRGRFVVTASQDAMGNHVFFVHDRETDKVYHRTLQSWEMPADGLTVEKILAKH